MLRASICIPSYNHREFLEEAVRSALAQTERDIEVIVIDDGSSDGSIPFCETVADPRFRFVVNPRRLGLSGNFNKCLRQASADYIKILCDDDILEDQAIARLADALDGAPNASFASSDRWVLSESGDRKLLAWSDRTSQTVSASEIVRRSLLCFNIIGEPSAVLLRRSTLPKGGFNEDMQQMVDWDLWLRVLARGDLAYVHETLVSYRSHAASASSRNASEARVARDLLLMARLLNGNEYPPVTSGQVFFLRLLCLGRALAGCLDAALKRNLPAARVCFAIARDACRQACNPAPVS